MLFYEPLGRTVFSALLSIVKTGSKPDRGTIMSRPTLLRRVHLQRPINPLDLKLGVEKMNVYVDERADLKVGAFITLADSEHPMVKWYVKELEEVRVRTDIRQGWNNNI